MRLCVYKPIIGDYDILYEPRIITPGWDYICFTDNKNLKSKTWDIRHVKNTDNLNKSRFSRSFWILNHKYVNEYDISISIGGQITPNSDLNYFLKKFLPENVKIDMVMHDRNIRKGVYHEAAKCIVKKKDDPKIIKSQMEFYKKEGMPDNTGIISSGIIIRKHHRKNVEEHCKKWWEQVNKWSFRDQLSFNYILWKYNLVNISLFDQDVIRGENNYFIKRNHKKMEKR